MIETRCPHCRSKFRIPARIAGMDRDCPQCGKPFTVAAVETEPETGNETADKRLSSRERAAQLLHEMDAPEPAAAARPIAPAATPRVVKEKQRPSKSKRVLLAAGAILILAAGVWSARGTFSDDDAGNVKDATRTDVADSSAAKPKPAGERRVRSPSIPSTKVADKQASPLRSRVPSGRKPAESKKPATDPVPPVRKIDDDRTLIVGQWQSDEEGDLAPILEFQEAGRVLFRLEGEEPHPGTYDFAGGGILSVNFATLPGDSFTGRYTLAKNRLQVTVSGGKKEYIRLDDQGRPLVENTPRGELSTLDSALRSGQITLQLLPDPKGNDRLLAVFQRGKVAAGTQDLAFSVEPGTVLFGTDQPELRPVIASIRQIAQPGEVSSRPNRIVLTGTRKPEPQYQVIAYSDDFSERYIGFLGKMKTEGEPQAIGYRVPWRSPMSPAKVNPLFAEIIKSGGLDRFRWPVQIAVWMAADEITRQQLTKAYADAGVDGEDWSKAAALLKDARERVVSINDPATELVGEWRIAVDRLPDEIIRMKGNPDANLELRSVGGRLTMDLQAIVDQRLFLFRDGTYTLTIPDVQQAKRKPDEKPAALEIPGHWEFKNGEVRCRAKKGAAYVKVRKRKGSTAIWEQEMRYPVFGKTLVIDLERHDYLHMSR